MRKVWLLATACTLAMGCTSPEATRQRGGGPGADPGNRPAQVLMHEGSQQYWETPVLIESEGPSLAPSQQARQLSLPSAAPAAEQPGSEANDATPREGTR